jgi:hypothetical protein
MCPTLNLTFDPGHRAHPVKLVDFQACDLSLWFWRSGKEETGKMVSEVMVLLLLLCRAFHGDDARARAKQRQLDFESLLADASFRLHFFSSRHSSIFNLFSLSFSSSSAPAPTPTRSCRGLWTGTNMGTSDRKLERLQESAPGIIAW